MRPSPGRFFFHVFAVLFFLSVASLTASADTVILNVTGARIVIAVNIGSANSSTLIVDTPTATYNTRINADNIGTNSFGGLVANGPVQSVTPGSTISVGANIVGEPIGTFPPFLSGRITITGAGTISAFAVGTQTLVVPITATGLLVATDFNPFSTGVGFPLSVLPNNFTLNGIAIIQLFGAPGESQLRVTGLTYAFGTQATPEPATMILLGTGLAGVAARVRRRRKE